MSHVRLVASGVVAVVAIAAAFLACSSFSSSETPAPETEGGDLEASVEAAVADGGADALACSADLATDPSHCGRCGHSCLGGTCIDHECQPIVVGTSTGELVVDVAVDAPRVLWLTSTGIWSNLGHVYSCPRAGCAGAAPTSVTGPPVSTGSLAGDGVTAYFSVPYAGSRVDVILPNGEAQMVGNAHSEAVRLQIHGGSLFFETLYEGAPPYTGHVFRWDGTKEETVGAWSSPHNLNDLVIVGNRAFFSGAEFLATCTLGGPTDCATPTEVINTGGEYYSLTTDGALVIWSDGSAVYSCPGDAPTCSAAKLLVGPVNLHATARGVTFDHNSLYVTTANDDLFRCSLPDCAGTLTLVAHEKRLYQGSDWLYGHAVTSDESAIYWAAVDGMETTDAEGGVDAGALVHRIMKLAK